MNQVFLAPFNTKAVNRSQYYKGLEFSTEPLARNCECGTKNLLCLQTFAGSRWKHQLITSVERKDFFSVSHPSQSEVHLQLGHPLPNTGPHAHPKRDEAVGVVLVVAVERCVVAQPALRQEPLGVHELRLVVTDGVVTQMELSLKRQRT